ncbi:MAG: M1 family metallopeptidase [Longimicrobiales bacterium]
MMKRALLAGMLVLSGACATSSPPPPVATGPVTVDTTPLRVRHAVRPVPYTNAFAAAIERGTRTDDGLPGPDYWQQRVQYRIEAELDPATARLSGAETIVYHNNSPDTLRELRFMLYQNAFAPGVQRVRQVPITGGTKLERVMVEGRPAREGPVITGPLTYAVSGTQMRLSLPGALPPGGSTTVQIAWSQTVPPRGAPRTGHAENEAFVVAQWYPQVAVYDDVNGWHSIPYWTNGEFYLEYADFDVTLTLPEGWLVDATGVLQNPDEVLPEPVRARVARALTQDSIVHVVTENDVEDGAATERAPGEQLEWRFVARDVRDFAFATSNRYVWDATRAILPDAHGDGRPDTVLVNAFYRPDFPAWREGARYTQHAVKFHAENWHPYIYPKITSAEGPIGGMEYPMLVFIGSPSDSVALYSVISHEVAHQWYPMMVGSNESRYAWQDEGLVTYVEDLSVSDIFTGLSPALASQRSYLRIAGSDAEGEIMRAPDLFGIGPQYGVAAYTKPGTMLRALAGVLGEDTVKQGLRMYAERWLLKHPTPWDFFATMEAAAGRDLDWFWHPWFFETATLDQAVTEVRQDVAGAEIVVEDIGSAPMPVLLRITLADGSTVERTLPVEPWLEGRTQQALRVDGQVTRVEIDPDQWFPDVQRANNVWSAGAQ